MGSTSVETLALPTSLRASTRMVAAAAPASLSPEIQRQFSPPAPIHSAAPVNITGNNTVTLQPGKYFGGIDISGNANVTFSPGTYILAGGGLTVNGNSTLKGTGVTFYNSNATGYAYAPIDLTGNETANLSAPTSGTY